MINIWYVLIYIVVQIYDADILSVRECEKNTNSMLINIHINRPHFDSFTEITKIKNYLFNVIKNKLFDSEKLIARLNNKIKETHDISLECRSLIV